MQAALHLLQRSARSQAQQLAHLEPQMAACGPSLALHSARGSLQVSQAATLTARPVSTSSKPKQQAPVPQQALIPSLRDEDSGAQQPLAQPALKQGRARARKDPLQMLEGVGPVGASKLRSVGYETFDQLARAFTFKFFADSDKMVQHLKEDVGLRTLQQCERVTQALKEDKARQDAKWTSRAAAGVSLCVEGNISAGKSTFLREIEREMKQQQQQGTRAQGTLDLQRLIEVVPEPVEKWQDVDGRGGGNILEAFYNEPKRYAYTFQNLVFLTRCNQEVGSRNYEQEPEGLRLLERSVWSDRMVFVRAVHNSDWMSDLELSVYNSWFDPMVTSVLPSLVPDGFIYLRAEPKLCKKRMTQRARSEEGGVELGYLEQLHQMHEDWLRSGTLYGHCPDALRHRRLSDTNTDMMVTSMYNTSSWPAHEREFQTKNHAHDLLMSVPLPACLEGKVRTLDAQEPSLLHKKLDKVPALELDCGGSYDILQDHDARAELAKQVEAYRTWVKQYREFNAETQRRMNQAAGLLAGSSSSTGLAGQQLQYA